MDHKHLLKSIGGEHAVHAQLVSRGVAVTPIAVRAWALSGRSIPAKYWSYIRDIAAERGVCVSIDDLAESVKATASIPQRPTRKTAGKVAA